MKLLANIGNRQDRLFFPLILLSSTLFYLYNINFSDIWIDESFTKALMEHSFSDMLGLIKNDFHPPLYFYGLKVFVTIFGLSAFTIRLFSVLGVVSTIVLGYVTGQRVFGKTGALYFCILLFSLPMLAAYSHDARMYTWGAFSVTGVFLYAVLFITTNKRRDLISLMLFSLIAAYTHYFALIAVAGTNIFVAVYLIVTKNKSWRMHLGYALIAVILYIPWLLVLLHHTQKAQEFFWVPPVTLQTILKCFTEPFAEKFWMSTYSWPMVYIVYSLTLWVIYRNFIARKDGQGLVLGLSLFIFGFTVLATAVISLFSQPILFPRYIMNIVVMLIIPPTLFFIAVKNKWVKGIILCGILGCGIIISLGSARFSFGPYKQSIEYLHKTYPEVKKVFHVIEVTTGPFVEYRNYGIENYWYNPANTTVFTNMNVYKSLLTTDSLAASLTKGEAFCVASFPGLPFNEKNLEKILSESQLQNIDTVSDDKAVFGNKIILYILKYGTDKAALSASNDSAVNY